MQLVTTLGQASLYRKETYNHRTTALIEWVVRVGNVTIRECNTRREAMVWLNIYKN